jgi:hypothetical protein
MSLKIRRVVTGHDDKGHAVVLVDELAKNVKSSRPGASSANIWLTDEWPIGSDGSADPSGRPIGTVVPDGTVFRVVQYEPGVTPRRHRTDSIDYAVVVSGAIDMELDNGVVVSLNAGDVLVQRATVHNWVNRGAVPCVIAFVLVNARPATLDGAPLPAHG